MQQRYYDPEVGRFLSVDPMPSDTATGWNFNRYNYAANNPYTFVDPDGRMVGKPWEEPSGSLPDPLSGPDDLHRHAGLVSFSEDGGQSQAAGFDAALDQQISNVRAVREAHNQSATGTRFDSGSEYRNQDIGGFIFEASLLDRLLAPDRIMGDYLLGPINVRAAQGLFSDAGLFGSECLTCVQEGSLGLVLGVRPYTRLSDIVTESARFGRISRLIGAPVYVVSNGAEVYQYSGSSNPTLIRN